MNEFINIGNEVFLKRKEVSKIVVGDSYPCLSGGFSCDISFYNNDGDLLQKIPFQDDGKSIPTFIKNQILTTTKGE